MMFSLCELHFNFVAASAYFVSMVVFESEICANKRLRYGNYRVYRKCLVNDETRIKVLFGSCQTWWKYGISWKTTVYRCLSNFWLEENEGL